MIIGSHIVFIPMLGLLNVECFFGIKNVLMLETMVVVRDQENMENVEKFHISSQ